MAYLGNTPATSYYTMSKQTFTPDSTTTVFTLDYAVANENEIELFIDNVRQEPGSGKAYTASLTTLTMSEAPLSGQDMYAIFQGKAQTSATLPGQSISDTHLTTTLDLSSKTLTLPASSVTSHLSYSSGTATGDGATTTFTISANRTVNDILVHVNGILYTPTTDYTISGTTLTFASAPANSAEIDFRYLPK